MFARKQEPDTEWPSRSVCHPSMKLHDYYEGMRLWDRSLYVQGYEHQRLLTAVEMLPQDCRSVGDIGCGNAAFLALLEAHRPAVRGTGLDPSHTAVAQRWCASPVVMGQIGDLPFPDKAFDVVASMAVLEHIPDAVLGRAANEIMRVSARYILLNLPYRERRCRIRCTACGCGFDPHLHLRSYDDPQIERLFPGFIERRRVVLSGEESLLAYCALRLLRLEVSARRFPNAACPQCGHRSEPGTIDAGAQTAPRRPTLRRLWRLQPKINVVREIFVLFERADAATAREAA
jgi:SAM-dependent methyltransferase